MSRQIYSNREVCGLGFLGPRVYENIMFKNTVAYFISTVQGKFEAFRYEMIKDWKVTFDTSDTRKQYR